MRLIAAGGLREVFNSENLIKTFGGKGGLFDKVFLYAKEKEEGMI
jgi:hypothetical protein